MSSWQDSKCVSIELKISKVVRPIVRWGKFSSHAKDVKFPWWIGMCIFRVMQFKHHDGVMEIFPFLAYMRPWCRFWKVIWMSDDLGDGGRMTTQPASVSRSKSEVEKRALSSSCRVCAVIVLRSMCYWWWFYYILLNVTFEYKDWCWCDVNRNKRCVCIWNSRGNDNANSVCVSKSLAPSLH